MKKALVIVDFQNDFISGSLGFEKANSIRQPIVEKIEDALKNDIDIIFTMDTHDSAYLQTAEGISLPVEHCIKGTWGWELDDSVLPYKNKGVVIEKPTFGSMALGSLLFRKDYDEIEFCGLVTSICVLSNVVIARSFSPRSRIIVDSKATEDVSAKESALTCLKSIMVDVI